MTNETVIAILSELKKCYLGGIVDALDFAIEVVKTQEPRAVIPAIKKDNELLREGKCPVCGMKLDWLYNGDYCGCCGQAVRWE